VDYLQKLFGKEWVDENIKSPHSRHPLALWYRKGADNPVVRYADGLAEFILKNGLIECDSVCLASKLKAEFPETLAEMGYAVFLGKQRFQVTMEPSYPDAGPISWRLVTTATL
jgi:hypothetical protein